MNLNSFIFRLSILCFILFNLSIANRSIAAVIIVDNDSPSYTETGVWAASKSIGYNNGTYRYASPTSANTATWTVDLPESGVYEVAVWYILNNNRCTTVRYEITAADGPHTATINQQLPGYQWVPLGRFSFTAGKNTIRLNAQQSYGGEVVIADAVRLRNDTGYNADILHTLKLKSGNILHGTITLSDDQVIIETNNNKLTLIKNQIIPPESHRYQDNIRQSFATGNYERTVALINQYVSWYPDDIQFRQILAQSRDILEKRTMQEPSLKKGLHINLASLPSNLTTFPEAKEPISLWLFDGEDAEGSIIAVSDKSITIRDTYGSTRQINPAELKPTIGMWNAQSYWIRDVCTDIDKSYDIIRQFLMLRPDDPYIQELFSLMQYSYSLKRINRYPQQPNPAFKLIHPVPQGNWYVLLAQSVDGGNTYILRETLQYCFEIPIENSIVLASEGFGALTKLKSGEPNKTELHSILDTFSKLIKENDTLVIAIASHAGNDGTLDISYQDLNQYLGMINKQARIIVILEGCNTGGAIPILNNAKVVYTSAHPDQGSGDAFFKYLIKALNGSLAMKGKYVPAWGGIDPKADLNGDRFVTFGEAFEYAAKQMKERKINEVPMRRINAPNQNYDYEIFPPSMTKQPNSMGAYLSR
ncbi:MAG: hypothetical protein ACE14V_13805 [bacterium]